MLKIIVTNVQPIFCYCQTFPRYVAWGKNLSEFEKKYEWIKFQQNIIFLRNVFEI